MMHQLFFMFAGIIFVISAWQWQAPYWNRLVSIGLTALTIALAAW